MILKNKQTRNHLKITGILIHYLENWINSAGSKYTKIRMNDTEISMVPAQGRKEKTTKH